MPTWRDTPPHGDFPQSNPVQAAFGGLYDAFVSQLNPAGNTLGFSTYFGGSGSDVANTLAVDASGNMFIGGQTSSPNLPLAAQIQSVNNGGSIGWMARLGVTARAPATAFRGIRDARLPAAAMRWSLRHSLATPEEPSR